MQRSEMAGQIRNVRPQKVRAKGINKNHYNIRFLGTAALALSGM